MDQGPASQSASGHDGAPRPYRSRIMRALRFEQLVTDLVTRRMAWCVEPERTVGARLVADIYAVRGPGEVTVVKIKYTSPQTGARVRDAIMQLRQLRDAVIEEIPGASVDLVLAFSGVLSSKYQAQLWEEGVTLWDANLLWSWAKEDAELAKEAAELLSAVFDETSSPLREAVNHLPDLSSIQCGKATWSQYQRASSEILEYLFCPPLNAPYGESANSAGVNKRDIILPNYCNHGFWGYLADRYKADYIVVDAKNYCEDVGKEQILQVANYLSIGGPGLFGMIMTRSGLNATAGYICREQWTLHSKLIIVIADVDVAQMIETKRSGGAPEELVRQKIEDFRLGI